MESINRDILFIGHATPEDNEFTLWLQSKLKNEGYNCECDLSFLLGGEADYWKNLQDLLEHQSIKYILVVSGVTFDKSGVLDEWEHCKSIERQYLLKDFIIPVKVDNSPYNSRIGLNRKNIISFENNWGEGLKRLLRKLAFDEVPKVAANTNSIMDWYDNVYTTYSGIEYKEKDLFYSNWLKIPVLPKKVHFYKFYNEEQAKAVLKNLVYPGFRHGNLIITFQKSLNYYLREENLEIKPTEHLVKDSTDALQWYESDVFPSYADFRRLLVRLLRECFESYLKEMQLKIYELSNSSCYFFEHKEEKSKGRFALNGKTKNIGVTGKYYDAFWHFGISFRPVLYPELCLSFKNHIIFTEDGVKPWTDKKQMHSARRNKGKTMHNKEWRDQLLAFLSCLANTESDEIVLTVAEDETITLSTTPITFEAKFSYIEPNDEERLKPIDSYLDEEEFYDDEEGGQSA